MSRLTVDEYGGFWDGDIAIKPSSPVDAATLQVDHLRPTVISYTMPDGQSVKAFINFSCHCWTVKYDDCPIGGQTKIMDGIRPRAFCPERFNASFGVLELFQNLLNNRIYLTPSDRNFGMYNANFIINGQSYTAYFTIEKRKGRANGIRYGLAIKVESAYFCPQPSKGSKVKGVTLIGQALKGKKIKYR